MIDSTPWTDLLNAGAAGAVIIVVILFLKFIRERDKDWRDFFSGLRSEDSQATVKLIAVMDRLITRIEHLEDKFDQHNAVEMEVLRNLTALMAKLTSQPSNHQPPRRRN